MKCIVFQCKNQLTEWELGKINPIKFSKFRMCKYCRTYNKDELRECTCGKPFQGGGMSLYCDDCKEERKAEQNRNRPKPTKEKVSIYNKRHYVKNYANIRKARKVKYYERKELNKVKVGN
jgi:hypothetical protein